MVKHIHPPNACFIKSHYQFDAVYRLDCFLRGPSGLKKRQLIEESSLLNPTVRSKETIRTLRVFGSGAMEQKSFIVEEPCLSHSNLPK
jgi:hypothetical protein